MRSPLNTVQQLFLAEKELRGERSERGRRYPRSMKWPFVSAGRRR
jgi:hypothetical protein